MGQGLRDVVSERATELGDRAGGSAVVLATPVVESVSDALETSLVRTGAALQALRGGPVGPPVGVRRWPWALGAALAGAAAGAAVALLVERLIGRDAPDAQDPEDVQAVVDRPVDIPPQA